MAGGVVVRDVVAQAHGMHGRPRRRRVAVAQDEGGCAGGVRADHISHRNQHAQQQRSQKEAEEGWPQIANPSPHIDPLAATGASTKRSFVEMD
jgi:hypothetical protein